MCWLCLFVLSERESLLVLGHLPVLGSVVKRDLMERFGSASGIFEADERALLGVRGVGSAVARAVLMWREVVDLPCVLERLGRGSVCFVEREEENFPLLLRSLYDCPLALYVLGSLPVGVPCVSIVGTRRCTPYGEVVARRLASELAKLGVCVVSGMAEGIDTAAHEGALEGGGRTVAVLGSGIDVVYPYSNGALYQRLAKEQAVVSEWGFAVKPSRLTFPIRNRIIAGMSEAVVVVESNQKGGSMITARLAGQLDRPVFAVPGRVDSGASVGCHQLIRDGAILLGKVDHLLEELRWILESRVKLPSKEFRRSSVSLSAEEEAVMKALDKSGALSVDELAAELKWSVRSLGVLLGKLEMESVVKKGSDGFFRSLV